MSIYYLHPPTRRYSLRRASPWKFKCAIPLFSPTCSLVADAHRKPGKVRTRLFRLKAIPVQLLATTLSSVPIICLLAPPLRQCVSAVRFPPFSTLAIFLCIIHPIDDATILASSSIATRVNKVAPQKVRFCPIMAYNHCSGLLNCTSLGLQDLPQTTWLVCVQRALCRIRQARR
jgi:hypothetical protein